MYVVPKSKLCYRGMFVVFPLLSLHHFHSALFLFPVSSANRSTDTYFYFLFIFKQTVELNTVLSFLLNMFWRLLYISSFPFFCVCSFPMMNMGCLYSVAVVNVAAGNNLVDIRFLYLCTFSFKIVRLLGKR